MNLKQFIVILIGSIFGAISPTIWKWCIGYLTGIFVGFLNDDD